MDRLWAYIREGLLSEEYLRPAYFRGACEGGGGGGLIGNLFTVFHQNDLTLPFNIKFYLKFNELSFIIFILGTPGSWRSTRILNG